MDKISRSDDKYLALFQNEHRLIKQEKSIQYHVKQHEEQEREIFALFQLALRQSQEKEKMRIERTKYWSLIGSIVGTLFGIVGKIHFNCFYTMITLIDCSRSGATISNRYRLQEFHHLNRQSQKFVEDQILQQQSSIDELKQEFHRALSANDVSMSLSNITVQKQDELQSNILARMTLLILTTSCISLGLSFVFHHR
jgi:hypothetical protein